MHESQDNPFIAGPDADEPQVRQLVLVKHGQRYIFRYRDGEESQFLSNLVEMVRDPESHLDWFDAAVLSHQLGQGMSKRIGSMSKRAG